jgi:CheY-like chemotaxis protein
MSRKWVLIADDETEMREEIAIILRDEGYEVRTAPDGKAALKMIKKQKFDVLLLDLKMPVMTGYELLKELDSKNIHLKTIVLTGSILGSTLPDEKGISYKEKTRILKLADTVMNKPFDVMKLLDKVKQYSAVQ